MRRKAHPEASTEAAKDLICDLIAAAGGMLAGTVRLNKAFYFAHLYYWRDADGALTDHPIVRLPKGPCIDDYEVLLEELAEEGRIAISTRPIGPYAETVFKLTEERTVEGNPARVAAIRQAVEFVESHSAAQLSEITHEFSRSWQDTPNGQEMNVYADLLSERDLWEMRAQIDAVRALSRAEANGRE